MRRSFTTAALLAALAAAACTDTEPTGPRIRPGDARPLLTTETVVTYVDRLIPRLFPKGLETATGHRWSTVKEERRAGDIEGAAKHMRDLVKFVKLKTAEIENLEVSGEPVKFETKEHAAASLSFAMAIFVHKGETAEAPQTGGDVAFEVVPAGQAAVVVTPSERAAVDIPVGATSEDRLITIIQHPNEAFPGNCNGPLPTNLCQYPLFYDISSFPSLDFNTRIGVSVCAVTAGDRSPLDNPRLPAPEDKAVHDRLALARPYTRGKTTEGGRVIGQIEVLPARTPGEQKLLTHCEEIGTPVALATPRGGLLGRAQQGMLALANFAGRMLTPKNLYAIDAGPEHWTIGLGSPINAVDPESQPDLSAGPLVGPSTVVAGQSLDVAYTVRNTSPRQEGNATASSDPVNAHFTLRPEGATAGGIHLLTVNVPALRPDGDEQKTVSIPIDAAILGGRYVLVFDVEANDAGGDVEVASVASDPRRPEYTLGNNSASLAITVASELNYPTFTSTQGFLTAGTSGITTEGAFRLTDAADGQRGAFWSTTKMYLGDGFETTFKFRIANPSDGGADGLAFIVRGDGSATIGDGGGGIGYDGIAPSLAVEFDTWHNTEHQDPNNHHLSIRTQDTPRHTAFLHNQLLGGQLDNGAEHTVRITYRGGTLTVVLDGIQVASLSVTLPAGLLDANGRATVGFTGSTGAASESHHILSWFFRAPPAPPPIIS